MIPREGWKNDMTLRWILITIIVLFIFADLTK